MGNHIYYELFEFFIVQIYALCNFSTKNRIFYIENNSEFSPFNFNKVLMYTFGS